MPRCALCRRFGHDESQCVPSYANVAGSPQDTATASFVMDEDEAEDAARGGDNDQEEEVTPPEPSTSPAEDGSHAEIVLPKEKMDETTNALKEAEMKDDEQSRDETVESEGMEDEGATGSGAATSKRSWELTRDNTQSSGSASSEEPPLKATTQVRRPSTKTRPSVTPERHKGKASPT
ncbi:uncharacterized protein LOC144141346 [Haemaphysalis longicornis]